LPKGLTLLYSKVTDSTSPLLPSRVSRNHMVSTRQKATFRESRFSGLGTPLISLGSALMANSLCPGQEECTRHKPEIQFGNSG
jgi:hypothetical protein